MNQTLLPDSALLQKLRDYLRTHPAESLSSIASDGPSDKSCTSDDARSLQITACQAQMDPCNPFDYLKLADLYLAFSSPDLARSVYSIMDALPPWPHDYYDDPVFHRAWLDADQGCFDESLAAWAECKRRFPDAVDYIELYEGTTYHDMRDFDAAISRYRRFLAKHSAGNKDLSHINKLLQLALSRTVTARARQWPMYRYRRTNDGKLT